MGNLTLRSVKGSALTHTEVDNNFGYFTGSHAITGSLTVSGSSTFTNIGPAVFSGSVSISGSTEGGGSGHILTYNTASGEIFFTASSAIGGGGNSVGSSLYLFNNF